MGKAAEFKKLADTAHKSTIDALFNIVIHNAQQAAKKNLYNLSIAYPKHQADVLKPLLEKEGFVVTQTDTGLTIDFSAPAE